MKNGKAVVKKPDRWPVNGAELKLEVISRALYEFKKNPGYQTKENLISHINVYDLNKDVFTGEHRISEYEVDILNKIYLHSTIISLPSLRCYLYCFIGERTRLQKNLSSAIPLLLGSSSYLGIKEYEEGLWLPLKLYYYAYLDFTVDKDSAFAYKIIEAVKKSEYAIESSDLSDAKKRERFSFLSNSYRMLLNDLSYFHGNRQDDIWKFDRNELTELFALEARLLKEASQNPAVSPVAGMLRTQISNFILKSRHDYNEDYICKYVSEIVAESSFKNHQLWMNRIENLNDDREGRVLEELFEESEWLKSEWVRKPDLTPLRKYFVSSFSKSLNNDDMKDEYGKVVFGFKNDRIADLISPLREHETGNRKFILFSQVMAFDVLYDREEAKEELNYLFSIIDLFEMNDNEKNAFLQEILQYWLLSIKDPKWSKERERRYLIFLYDDYQYKEMKIEDNFLKIDTSLFLLPDFVIGNHPKKDEVKKLVDTNSRQKSLREYLFCYDCLNRDYDIVTGFKDVNTCPICSGNSIEIVYPGVSRL